MDSYVAELPTILDSLSSDYRGGGGGKPWSRGIYNLHKIKTTKWSKLRLT